MVAPFFEQSTRDNFINCRVFIGVNNAIFVWPLVSIEKSNRSLYALSFSVFPFLYSVTISVIHLDLTQRSLTTAL